MKARWYSPSIGRFVQPDTIIPDPLNPQSLNRYSYVSNRPLNLVDPTGHSCSSPDPYDPYTDYDCYLAEQELLASTVQMRILLKDGTIWFGHGVVQDDGSILTHNHWPWNNGKAVESVSIYDVSGSLVDEVAPTAITLYGFSDGSWADVAKIHLPAGTLADFPTAPLADRSSTTLSSLLEQEVALVTYQMVGPLGAHESGRESSVVWSQVTGTAFLVTDRVLEPTQQGGFNALTVDRALPEGASGGGAIIPGLGIIAFNSAHDATVTYGYVALLQTPMIR
jgi:hypothetical protein